jgi:outer membrane protein assembly factor BamD
MKRLLAIGIVSALLLSACAGFDEDETKNWTPERLHSEAKEKMDDGDYATAVKYLEKLEARYPYGRLAEQAQLEIAYAYYKDDEHALAVAAAERFIRLHPTHPNVDYAYYLRGLVNFHGEKGFVNWLFGAEDDLAERDTKGLREAYLAFKELVERFPHSRYAEDSAKRMHYLFEAQARHEIHVARYYYSRGAYVAAVNRSKYALENFPQTPATEDALGIQVMAYKRMGLDALYSDTLRILRLNFPQSRYIAEAEALKSGG